MLVQISMGLKYKTFKMIKKNKGQVGSTLTWFTAIPIIFFILIIFLFLEIVLILPNLVIKKTSEVQTENIQDLISAKTISALMFTETNTEGLFIYDSIKFWADAENNNKENLEKEIRDILELFPYYKFQLSSKTTNGGRSIDLFSSSSYIPVDTPITDVIRFFIFYTDKSKITGGITLK